MISDLAIEIARRARQLVHAKGVTLSPAGAGRELVIGRYYMRVHGEEIYINDMENPLAPTIFKEVHPNWIGRVKCNEDCSKLLLFLRTSMVLEDLADV